MAKRTYRCPELTTKELVGVAAPVLLACTGQVNCGDFGFTPGCCVPLTEEGTCGDFC